MSATGDWVAVSTTGWPAPLEPPDLVKRACRAASTAAYTMVGEGAIVITMVAKNGKPHSYHHMQAWGSCVEIRGLLEQGSDLLRTKLHGTHAMTAWTIEGQGGVTVTRKRSSLWLRELFLALGVGAATASFVTYMVMR